MVRGPHQPNCSCWRCDNFPSVHPDWGTSRWGDLQNIGGDEELKYKREIRSHNTKQCLVTSHTIIYTHKLCACIRVGYLNLTCVAGHLLLGRMGLMREILVLLWLLGVLAVLRVSLVLSVCCVRMLAVCCVWVLAVLAVAVRPVLREVRVRGAVAGVRRVGQGHLGAAVGDAVRVRVGDAVLTRVWVCADGAAWGVLVRAGGVALLRRLRRHTHQT